VAGIRKWVKAKASRQSRASVVEDIQVVTIGSWDYNHLYIISYYIYYQTSGKSSKINLESRMMICEIGGTYGYTYIHIYIDIYTYVYIYILYVYSYIIYGVWRWALTCCIYSSSKISKRLNKSTRTFKPDLIWPCTGMDVPKNTQKNQTLRSSITLW
jgi:hypothetical protein